MSLGDNVFHASMSCSYNPCCFDLCYTQALQYNQSLVVRKPEELVQLLRNGGSHELRAVFAAHEDHATGRVSDGPLRSQTGSRGSLVCLMVPHSIRYYVLKTTFHP